MKVLFAMAVVSSLAIGFAQQDSTTGTYTGTVEGMCLFIDDLDNQATNPPTDEAGGSGAGFVDTFRGTDEFTYRSNKSCAASLINGGAFISGPETVGGQGDVLECYFGNNGTQQLASLNESQSGDAEQAINYRFYDSDSILLAGTYKFSCTATITGL